MTAPEAPAADPAPAAPAHGRAGRNLPAAIAVGAALGGLVLGTVYGYKPLFIALLTAAILIGTWEVARSLRARGMAAPVVPLLVGAVAMEITAYRRGPEDLVLALFLTVVAVLIWRVPDGAAGYLTDVSAGVFTALYVPFLAGFASMLAAPDDGAERITVFIATTVASDIGGYTAGVLFGKHPLAPSVSPKKTWEGFAGSALTCMVCGALLVMLLLDGAVWEGVLVGLVIVLSATLGDLGQSMIKRDLGIKDMGSLLPGHGGLMERLDSLLATAPVTWLLLSALVPA